MFVRDQVDALRAAGYQVQVAHREMPGLRAVARRLGVGARARAGGPPAGAGPADPGSGSAAQPGVPSQTGGSAQTGESARAADAAEPGAWADAGGSAQVGRAAQAGSSVLLGAAGPGRPTPSTAQQVLRVGARFAREVHDTLGLAAAVMLLQRDLRDLEREHGRPDVLHAHNAFPAGVAAVRYGRARGIPVVITEHSSAFLRAQHGTAELRRAAATYAAADAVVAVSELQARSLPGVGSGVHVIPNVVPVDDFALRSPTAAAAGSVISIGTLLPHKGMPQVIRAYAALPAAVRAAHALCLVGAGPSRPGLEDLARDLEVDVRFTGHLDRPAVARELQQAAVLISGSPVETFGVTLVEGLAAGVPFVAPRSGGPQSIWTPGAGVLADGPDEAALSRALTAALALEASPAADQARRTSAVARYGPAAVAAELDALYDEVLTRRAR
ncbi:putative glycosyltransferase [Kineosphaera limosa NBRC 100340]|uniref:D-inositol 3-phosphate glycosyltransferase n=2 Tax=Kineosphaera TaxID=211469 RepID=K6XBF4_9MICO|nr:putative glycosyltransferase [Kineosphaera limosa NBRC 100340]